MREIKFRVWDITMEDMGVIKMEGINYRSMQVAIQERGGHAFAIDTTRTWICDNGEPVEEDICYYLTLNDGKINASVYGVKSEIDYSDGIDEDDYNLLFGISNNGDIRMHAEDLVWKNMRCLNERD